MLEWDCAGDGVFEAESDWTVPAARAHACTYTVDGTYEPSVRATNSLVNHLTSLMCYHVVVDLMASFECVTRRIVGFCLPASLHFEITKAAVMLRITGCLSLS